MGEEFPPGKERDKYDESFGNRVRTAHELTTESAVRGPGESPDQSGHSTLNVRAEGGVIRKLTVGGVTVLTSTETAVDRTDPVDGDFKDDFLQPVKLSTGTISLLPYGSSEGQPDHGSGRYTTYMVGKSIGNELELMANDTRRGLGHLKTFTVKPDGLEVVDEVVNTGDSPAKLSIGEHYYVAVDKDKMSEVKFVDAKTGAEQSIKVRVERDGDKQGPIYGPDETGPLSAFMEALRDGKTLYFEGFNGSQAISIPGIGEITLSANAEQEGTDVPVGLLIWHRPDSDTICFEPVAGVKISDEGRELNLGITLAPGKDMGEAVKFNSEIRVTAPQAAV